MVMVDTSELAALAAEFDAEIEAEAAADAYAAGFLGYGRGEPRPADPHAAEGWDEARAMRDVRVVMPRRPEGYWHMPLGTFE
jgi:hypothetical protein